MRKRTRPESGVVHLQHIGGELGQLDLAVHEFPSVGVTGIEPGPSQDEHVRNGQYSHVIRTQQKPRNGCEAKDQKELRRSLLTSD
jgi:hypothetical protein